MMTMLLCAPPKNDARKLSMANSLPIDLLLDDISQQLEQHHSLILTAEPGAGKTTRLPLALLQQAWLAGKRILMLEPRRMAARNAATFMARQLGEAVGETVGYHIRLERKVGPNTRLEVITEGLLTQRLQSDPELADVGLIIFDEFHERHLHADLALALSHQCQQLLRDDLRLLIMSATLDADALSQQLNAPCLHAPGRSHPVTVHYRPPQGQENLRQHSLRVLREALRDNSGDVLMFMPGVGAIQAVIDAWQDDRVILLPLHGQLSDAEQQQALQPQSKRKVIVATNIAESSLTIDGVDTVIDSGLERVAVFQPARGSQTLQTRPIAQASADQRSGRAGRQRAGQAYRLWAQSQHHTRPGEREAEISRSDLAALQLELLRWGANANELLWLSAPPPALLKQGMALLQQLDICNDGGQLTAHGQRCAQLGLEPRWSHALVIAAQHGSAQLACELAAYLQQWPMKQRRSDDLERELLYARQQPLWRKRIAPLAKRWQQTLTAIKNNEHANTEHTDTEPLDLAALLCLTFPDRIAKRRSQGLGVLMANGSGAELGPDSHLQQHNWLLPVQLGGQQTARIELAVALPGAAWLQQQPGLKSHTRIDIDWNEQGQLQALEKTCLGALVLQQQRLQQLSDEQWHNAWDSFFASRGLGDLPWDPRARQLQQRMQRMRQDQSENWPECDDEALLKRRQQWLLPHVASFRHQRQLQQLNLHQLLLQQLDWQQQQTLEQQLPEKWQSPAGNALSIDYGQHPPRVSARLQEFLGCQQHPTIGQQRQPLSIELLSPAQRPIQITADLPGFWHGSYSEVRKDMRGRYPKHYWPEDPATAEPQRHSIKRKPQ
jgi:ATP-dependent helicase HrpB